MKRAEVQEGRAKLYIGGTFDLLHAGHFYIFERLAKLGAVYVALNTDEFVKRYKKKPPVQSLEERTHAVLSCRYVEAALTNVGDEDSKPAILEVGPDFIVHGSDWTAANGLLEQMGLTIEWLHEHRIEMLYLDRLGDHSSTSLKARVRVNA